MIGAKEIKIIFDKLADDESFCRLILYGMNPFWDSRPNVIKEDGSHKTLLRKYIKFTPQSDSIVDDEIIRMSIYKKYSKLRTGNNVIRFETIQIDIYAPHRLADYDCRIYDIENRIVNLIDGMKMGINFLDYADGTFDEMPNVSGFSTYRMKFLVEEGRNPYAKH